jgi:hypothetical protein
MRLARGKHAASTRQARRKRMAFLAQGFIAQKRRIETEISGRLATAAFLEDLRRTAGIILSVEKCARRNVVCGSGIDAQLEYPYGSCGAPAE